MDNYSKIITFFLENGVQLNKEQLEKLKEATTEQIKQFFDRSGELDDKKFKKLTADHEDLVDKYYDEYEKEADELGAIDTKVGDDILANKSIKFMKAAIDQDEKEAHEKNDRLNKEREELKDFHNNINKK